VCLGELGEGGDVGAGVAQHGRDGGELVLQHAGRHPGHVGLHHHRVQRHIDAPRGVSRLGKNDPVRVLGILIVRSPAVLDTTSSRLPLRWVVRVWLRSWRAAPMCAVARWPLQDEES